MNNKKDNNQNLSGKIPHVHAGMGFGEDASQEAVDRTQIISDPSKTTQLTLNQTQPVSNGSALNTLNNEQLGQLSQQPLMQTQVISDLDKTTQIAAGADVFADTDNTVAIGGAGAGVLAGAATGAAATNAATVAVAGATAPTAAVAAADVSAAAGATVVNNPYVAPGQNNTASQINSAQTMPDSVFEPKTSVANGAYNNSPYNQAYNQGFAPNANPSHTSVLPAELIEERKRRADYQNSQDGTRFAAQNFSTGYVPQSKAEVKAAKKAQKQAMKQAAYNAKANMGAQASAPKKSHGCLIAFVTFIIVAALIVYAAFFALDYLSQQSGVAKDVIIARLAKPIQDFFQL